MLKLKSVQFRKVSNKTELIGTAWPSVRNIGLVALILVFTTTAIVLPLVLIEDDDVSNSTSAQNAVPNTGSSNANHHVSMGPTAATAASPGTTIIIQPMTYDPLVHPLRDGEQIFVDEPSLSGCPYGPGVSVLFDHTECQAMCNTILKCIGYNFNTVVGLCVFYTNILCMDNTVADTSGETQGYLKNRV